MPKFTKKVPTPTEAEPVSAAPEPNSSTEPVKNTDPVRIVGLEDDVTVKVAEVNQPAVVMAAQAEAQGFSKDVYEDAQDENRKRNFVSDILKARTDHNIKPYVPPPAPPAVVDRTNAEIAAGREQLAKHTVNVAAQRRPHVPDSREGTTTAVFRPEDYVPNMNKGLAANQSFKSLG